jgi:hypothetical protein
MAFSTAAGSPPGLTDAWIMKVEPISLVPCMAITEVAICSS